MYVVHCTQALLRRVGLTDQADTAASNTLLGPWYATVTRTKLQTAVFVNEATLLPVLLRLAPSATLLQRFPAELGRVLAAHGGNLEVIGREIAAMSEHATRKTASRSLVGMLNEFVLLSAHHLRDPNLGLTELSVSLARTPCGPLYKRHVSPDRELAALLQSNDGAG